MKKLYPYLLALGLFFLMSGCVATSAYNTLPDQTAQERPLEAVLYIPAGLQIVSVDYDAELYMEASDGTTWSEGKRGRAFINVYAVNRQSGDQYLLIYESMYQSLRPIQIIHFQQE